MTRRFDQKVAQILKIAPKITLGIFDETQGALMQLDNFIASVTKFIKVSQLIALIRAGTGLGPSTRRGLQAFGP